MTTAYLSIGSNMGDSRAMLAEAAARLGRSGAVVVAAASSVYRTSPLGVEDQPDFLNAALKVETSLAPVELLKLCKEIETAMGRDFKAERWGPRPIDIDIIFHGDAVMDTPELTIPHPRHAERLFVLLPLVEIAPELTAPGGRRLADIIAEGDFAEQRVEKEGGEEDIKAGIRETVVKVYKCPYLGAEVELTVEREQHIGARHPDLFPEFAGEIATALIDPDTVRRSSRAHDALLFSRWYNNIRGGKHVVVVVMSNEGTSKRNWILTAYLARRLAEGDSEWKRN